MKMIIICCKYIGNCINRLYLLFMANYQVGITISLQLQVYKTYLKYISWILTFYIFVLEKLYISEFTKMSYESFIKYILFINFIWSYIHSSVYNIINMKYLSKSHIFTQCKININNKKLKLPCIHSAC